MRKWRWLVGFAAAGAACALVAQSQGPAPKVGAVLPTLDAAGTPLHVFADGEFCTVNLLAAGSPVPAHYHAVHEETVYVVRGSGVMRLGDQHKAVGPGDLMHIPKGVVHAFEPFTKDVVVVSIFAPKWDGKDRIFVGR